MKTVVIKKIRFSDYYRWGGEYGKNENNCVLAKYLGKPVVDVEKTLKELHYKMLLLSSKEYSEYTNMISNFDDERADKTDIEILKRLKSRLRMRLVIRK